MAQDLNIDYAAIAAARRALENAHDAVELRQLRGLESAPSVALRRARDDASDYTVGVLARATIELMRAERQLRAIESSFQNVEATINASLANKGVRRKP